MIAPAEKGKTSPEPAVVKADEDITDIALTQNCSGRPLMRTTQIALVTLK